MQTDTQKVAYTVGEVAKLLGISQSTTYDSCRRGDLPVLKMGRRILIPRMAFERYLAAKSTEFENHLKDRDNAKFNT